MADWRWWSPEVPLGSSFGPSVTGVFCGVIAKGSILYNRLSRNPGVIYALVAGIVLLAVYLTRRTTWSPAPVVPLDQPRRTGQILTAAARVYGVRGRELLALGAVFVPLSLLAALLQQLIFENGFVDALGHATASDAASAAIALIAGTFSTAVAYTLVVARVRRSRPRRLEAHRHVDDRARSHDARAGAGRGNRPDLHDRAASVSDQRRGLDRIRPRRAVHGHGDRAPAPGAPAPSRDGRRAGAGRSLSDGTHRLGERAYARFDGRLGNRPVAEHQRRRAGLGCIAVIGHRVEDDPVAGGLVADGLCVRALRQLDRHVQTGRDACHHGLGQLALERLHHRIALL